MSCALRDEASIETAINTTRLPRPSAATIHVFSRMSPPRDARLSSVRHPSGGRHPVNGGGTAKNARPPRPQGRGSPAKGSVLQRRPDGRSGASDVYSLKRETPLEGTMIEFRNRRDDNLRPLDRARTSHHLPP